MKDFGATQMKFRAEAMQARDGGWLAGGRTGTITGESYRRLVHGNLSKIESLRQARTVISVATPHALQITFAGTSGHPHSLWDG